MFSAGVRGPTLERKETSYLLCRAENFSCSRRDVSYFTNGRSTTIMRHPAIVIFCLVALCCGIFVPAASAQDDKNHGNFGIYLDYTRLTLAKANMFGVGGRVGLNVTPHVVMEGEMAWDFERSTTATITSSGITNTFRSDLRLLHRLFGPKFQTTGPVPR